MSYTKSEIALIEKAISFLVKQYSITGFNKKPVIFHSLKVAYSLIELNLDAEIIIAAILHDLLEDSKVTSKQIQKNFNKDIARLVEAVSFNPYIKDKEEQYIEMFIRTKKAGFPALAVKCADLLDNSNYYQFERNKKSKKLLLDKLSYFLKISKEELKDFLLYKELNSVYKKQKHN
ncbi:MAG TPA: HD domain-containing protein [Ignavibacteria bacterium]|nr:HD domain-containing protein [Ignavibacteria bacterium]